MQQALRAARRAEVEALRNLVKGTSGPLGLILPAALTIPSARRYRNTSQSELG